MAPPCCLKPRKSPLLLLQGRGGSSHFLSFCCILAWLELGIHSGLVASASSTSASSISTTAVVSSSSSPRPCCGSISSITTRSTLFSLRGGEVSKKKSKQKKKNAKKKKKTKSDQKEIIDKVLKEKDSAQLLGDAIRERAEELLEDDKKKSFENPLLRSIDQSVTSLGWALGASDQRLADLQLQHQQDDDHNVDADHDAAGVEVAPASVLVQYFLKSHGGAHALQSLCSVLASVAGLGAVTLDNNNKISNNKALSLLLLQRCCLFAMIKHASGLLAGSWLAARSIPEIGLRQARVWMQELAADPVSQYTFYAACILMWTKSGGTTSSIITTSSADTSTTGAVGTGTVGLWWQEYRLFTFLLVGPIVLREVVSTLLVLSDVLVLWTCASSSSSSSGSSQDATGKQMAQKILAVASAATNAVMSLLVTPSVWKAANPARRQAILAKLTSKTSLAMEVAVGVLLLVDALMTVIAFFFSNNRKQVADVMKRLVCTKLYWNFLWTRRRKIKRLGVDLRGGATQLPFYVLDVLMDPLASIGMEQKKQPQPERERMGENNNNNKSARPRGWRDYLELALDLDD